MMSCQIGLVRNARTGITTAGDEIERPHTIDLLIEFLYLLLRERHREPDAVEPREFITMSDAESGAVRSLYHYPIKGLSPQPLQSVELTAGCGFPFDREFGLARFDSGFDPRDPRPLRKNHFLMLARDERLASLQTHLDPQTAHFTIHVAGRPVHEADLSEPAGAAATGEFFGRTFGLDEAHRPTLAHAVPHRFTDVSVDSPQMMNAISLINLASVEDLGRRIGAQVDPLRFRANVYFDGWAPFSELERVDQEIRVGSLRLRFLRRIGRCAATEVNLQTATRDLPIPRMLKEQYGHIHMGVYAEVLTSGSLKTAEVISVGAG
jgi:hypothetical protein